MIRMANGRACGAMSLAWRPSPISGPSVNQLQPAASVLRGGSGRPGTGTSLFSASWPRRKAAGAERVPVGVGVVDEWRTQDGVILHQLSKARAMP